MSNDELILAELRKINSRLDGMEKRMASMEDKLEAIEEDVAENRGATNMLVKWAEKVTQAMSLPLPKL